ncbi:MAG: hypothetical protein PHX51_00840 [Clostridia bacterium]|nr:hypothetical protein [Clostridia bacterium]
MSENYGLVGCGIQKSLSPIIHKIIFEETGFDAVYRLVDASALFGSTIDVRKLSFAEKCALRKKCIPILNFMDGYNVTTPFKEIEIAYSEPCGPAKYYRSINTVQHLSVGGLLKIGFSTDIFGFRCALDNIVLRTIEGLNSRTNQAYLSNAIFKNALVIGTGGAAKAVAYELMSITSNLYVLSSSIERAKLFAKSRGYTPIYLNNELTPPDLELCRISKAKKSKVSNEQTTETVFIVDSTAQQLSDVNNSSSVTNRKKENGLVFDLVVDCSLGVENPRILDGHISKKGLIFDLHIGECELSRYAHDNNIAYSDGLDMLIFQAIKSESIWQSKKFNSDRIFHKVKSELITRGYYGQ